MSNSENYEEFAEQACMAERLSHWDLAYDCWKAAAEIANQPCNREWALKRAEFCASQHSMNDHIGRYRYRL